MFSHPRSGTHFLEAFLARNFYPDEDLSVAEVPWGHWADRSLRDEGNPYGKLFGSHVFPERSLRRISYPAVYIWRDGRAVAYSLWRTKEFLHPDHRDISLSDFLRQKLDWIGSPGYAATPLRTIAEHWEEHVLGWRTIAGKNPNVLVVAYEDLLEDPWREYGRIHAALFPHRRELPRDRLDPVGEPVGIAPHEAARASWREAFSDEDEEYFLSRLRTIDLP